MSLKINFYLKIKLENIFQRKFPKIAKILSDSRVFHAN